MVARFVFDEWDHENSPTTQSIRYSYGYIGVDKILTERYTIRPVCDIYGAMEFSCYEYTLYVAQSPKWEWILSKGTATIILHEIRIRNLTLCYTQMNLLVFLMM